MIIRDRDRGRAAAASQTESQIAFTRPAPQRLIPIHARWVDDGGETDVRSDKEKAIANSPEPKRARRPASHGQRPAATARTASPAASSSETQRRPHAPPHAGWAQLTAGRACSEWIHQSIN